MPDPIQQAAALPIRDGRVCLITSRRRTRWIVPKGHLELGHTLHQTAITEAWEEAGLIGEVRPEPIGTFSYSKLDREYQVTVFVMDVLMESTVWPECKVRTREWMSAVEAIRRIEETGLRAILRQAMLIGGVMGPPLLSPQFLAHSR